MKGKGVGFESMFFFMFLVSTSGGDFGLLFV